LKSRNAGACWSPSRAGAAAGTDSLVRRADGASRSSHQGDPALFQA
jgi:hypothetical protein